MRESVNTASAVAARGRPPRPGAGRTENAPAGSVGRGRNGRCRDPARCGL